MIYYVLIYNWFFFFLYAVFSYVPLIHNVVIVNEIGFNYCSTLGASGLYASGSDRITLTKGANYFISGFPDQCLLGMKIAVNAN
jgi:hypothetical protein